jgi:hypothetical protein
VQRAPHEHDGRDHGDDDDDRNDRPRQIAPSRGTPARIGRTREIGVSVQGFDAFHPDLQA